MSRNLSLFATLVLFVILGSAPQVKAQDEPSKLDLYGGYDYVRFNINSGVSGQPPSQTFNGNGGGGQLVYNVNNWFSVLGNVAGYWATNSSFASGAAIPYLFGPRVSLRRRSVTPFAQVLFGGMATSSGI